MPEIERPSPKEGERAEGKSGLEVLDAQPEVEENAPPEMVIEEPGATSPEGKLTQEPEQPEVLGKIQEGDVNYAPLNTSDQAARLTDEVNAVNQ